MIFGLLISVIGRVYFSVNRQGIKQDKETTAWYVYCEAIEALKLDLSQATELHVSENSIEMKIVRMGENRKFEYSDVTWNLGGNSLLNRMIDGKKSTYEFAGALSPGEKINIKFALLP